MSLVDELVSFDYNAPGVASGWVYAQCEVCDAHTAGTEATVEDWARRHVESRHTGGRHTHWIRPHEPLVLDPGDHIARHSEAAAEIRGVWFRWHDDSNVGIPAGFYTGGRYCNDPAVTA
ncbi:MAG: hypothetical protein AB1925_12680 [Actinomycetota bacterium]